MPRKPITRYDPNAGAPQAVTIIPGVLRIRPDLERYVGTSMINQSDYWGRYTPEGATGVPPELVPGQELQILRIRHHDLRGNVRTWNGWVAHVTDGTHVWVVPHDHFDRDHPDYTRIAREASVTRT